MKNLLFILSAFFLIMGCSKEDRHSNSSDNRGDNEISLRQKLTRDSAKDLLAKELSILLSNKAGFYAELENAITSRTSSGWYENEFFWNLDKDNIVQNGQSISTYLIEQNANNADLLNFIEQNLQFLTIMMDGNYNASSLYNPEVFSNTYITDANGTTFIKKYNDGVESTQNAAIFPTTKTFGIKECEVCFLEADLNTEFVTKDGSGKIEIGTTNYGDIWAFAPPGSGGGGGGGTNDPDCLKPCQRDCVDGTENLRRFYSTEDYDNQLFQGKGEFVFYHIFADEVSHTYDNGDITIVGNSLDYTKHTFVGVDEGDPEWYYPNFGVINWDTATDGNRIKMILIETDGGFYERDYSTILKFEVFGIGVEQNLPWKIRYKDQVLGEVIVEYCQDIDGVDGQGYQYNPTNEVKVFRSER